ncbi:CPBP family intramembrane glutamic endopeptidase [Cereibacter sphaeroides]|uniref:CPBP family intramembrane glutamic endopeptidase n=1 Tax=Cereibacter sphaeroides TaxID=1063 RepID=UPI00313E1103
MTAKPDFPFYNDRPIPFECRDWLLLMGALAVALAVLTLLPLRHFPQDLVPALLFLAIPLLALRQVAGPHWTAVFRPVGLREIGLMLLFGLLTLGGSILAALILSQFFTLSGNPVAESFDGMTGLSLAARLLPTVPQLIGEELLGILPFLAVLWICVTRMGLSRRAGIIAGLLASALVFGAAHLPTYDWNWVQALLGIGFARIFLTLAYIATRNLWVSAGAHVLNDWTGFLVAFTAGHAPIGSDP